MTACVSRLRRAGKKLLLTEAPLRGVKMKQTSSIRIWPRFRNKGTSIPRCCSDLLDFGVYVSTSSIAAFGTEKQKTTSLKICLESITTHHVKWSRNSFPWLFRNSHKRNAQRTPFIANPLSTTQLPQHFFMGEGFPACSTNSFAGFWTEIERRLHHRNSASKPSRLMTWNHAATRFLVYSRIGNREMHNVHKEPFLDLSHSLSYTQFPQQSFKGERVPACSRICCASSEPPEVQ